MQPWLLVDNGGNSTYDIPLRPEIKQTSSTAVDITIYSTESYTKYVVTKEKFSATGISYGSPTAFPDFSVNSALNTHTLNLTGLDAGGIYVFRITPYNGATFGNKTELAKFYMQEINTVNGAAVGNLGNNVATLEAGKPYLQLTNTEKASSTIVSREFSAVASTPTVWTYNPFSGAALSNNKTTAEYYSFGTSVLMNSLFEDPIQGAGIGFFMDSKHKNGYAILIQTIPSSISSNNKTVRIVKIYNGGIRNLSDTQKSIETTLDGVYGGRIYNIDIKVKVLNSTITINAYINGFKITAIDNPTLANAAGDYKFAEPTNRVGLICMRGKAMFDYVYGSKIDDTKYNNAEYVTNFYQGQFSNDMISSLYGDYQYLDNAKEDNVSLESFEEFGTTAREIVKKEVKFDSRPSVPLKWSTGANQLAKIISQKTSSFGGEAFVLNNSSTTIPLADANGSTFYIFGNTIGQSGTLEYVTDEDFNYGTKEPVVFESSWLQTIDSVKSLANWIKNTVVNRGKVVQLQVFGNPLISVGDIVSVIATYQGFNGEERLIVTNVTHTYNNGLETTLTCRTL